MEKSCEARGEDSDAEAISQESLDPEPLIEVGTDR